MAGIEIDLAILKAFWEDEVIASSLYKFIRRKVSGDRKGVFQKLSEMEAGHASTWNKIAKKLYGKEFKIGIGLKLKIILYKILALILPLSFLLYYLELGEKNATVEYSKILKSFEGDPELYKKVRGVIYDEIDHEITFIEMILGEKSKIAKIKDAIYGMTDSLVEILALVIGLSSVIINPLAIGLAGLIAAIGGTFSMTSGAYLSAKSQNDIYLSEKMEIEMKKMIDPKLLKRDLILGFKERDVKEDTARKIVEAIEEDPEVLANITESVTVEESPTNPKEVAVTTGVYYILGALPAILPYFIGSFLSIHVVIIAIIAVTSAAIVSFFAGIFTAVLSGINIKRKAFENVLIVIGSSFATYLIGAAARFFFGIEI
ncbi:MAG: VIT1/CCC1 transporter family protein [Candidatus Njordarchaeia archaeon]